MNPFDCRPLNRTEVARQLAESEIASSRAIPGATLYNLKRGAQEWLLIALPDGAGLAVDVARPPPRRRRIDTGKAGTDASPASR